MFQFLLLAFTMSNLLNLDWFNHAHHLLNNATLS